MRAGGGSAQALAHPRWAWDVGLRGRPHSLGNFAPVVGKSGGLDDYFGWIGENFDPSLTWRISTGSARAGTGR